MPADETAIRHTPEVRPFSKILPLIDHGNLEDQLTAAISDVATEVGRLEKKGSVTLKLTIEPAGSGGRSVTVAGVVDSKPPEPAPPTGFFFIDGGGGLHREDPYSQRLPIDAESRQLPDDTDPPRTITD